MTPEKPESAGAKEFDFAGEFRRRLTAIPNIDGKDSLLEGKLYRGIGIVRLKHKVPAILFLRDEKKLDLWTEDPQKMYGAYPHSYLDASLKRQFPELDNRISLGTAHAVILEDWENHTYLSVDRGMGKIVKTIVAEGSSEIKTPWFNIDTLEDLVKRYGIHKITSSMPQEVTKGNQSFHWSRDEEILTLDIVGQYREASFLRSYQERYEMTAAQFLRFRTLVNGAKKSNQPLNYDQLAAEIVIDEE